MLWLIKILLLMMMLEKWRGPVRVTAHVHARVIVHVAVQVAVHVVVLARVSAVN